MKILYLTNHQPLSEQFNDYLSNLLLHGLREHFDRNVIDFPGSWYLYKDASKKKVLIPINYGARGLPLKIFLTITTQSIETILKKKFKQNILI